MAGTTRDIGSMYKPHCDALADCCRDYFEQMLGTGVLETVVKPDQRADALYAVAVSVGYQQMDRPVAGRFTLGFTDADMALAMAATIAGTLGVTPPAALDSDATALLGEFLNTVFGRAVARWDTLGFKARFFPPTSKLNTSVQVSSEVNAEAYAIILSLKVHHVIFRIVFIDDADRPSTGKRIMVVDDSSVIRQLLSNKLRQLGFEVVQAEDGVAAVETHRRFRPDLTIMDQVMPRLNGLEAILEIRQEAPQAKFLMLTSSSRRDEIVTAGTLNVVRYLLKPLQLSDVVSAVVKALA